MSFIDLMANDDWSDADILSRTEAMIRAEFSADREFILNRKVSGSLLGQYALALDEQAELAGFAALTNAARSAGIQAKADMALLRETWAVEAAQAAFLTDPEDSDAQAVVDAASPEAISLALQRLATNSV